LMIISFTLPAIAFLLVFLVPALGRWLGWR
jgi:hypothetical protein